MSDTPNTPVVTGPTLPPSVQQYMRIALYLVFSSLASNGVQITDSTKNTVIGIVGILATLAWTMYGTRLNGLLEAVRAKTGVESVEIKVDPDLIKPVDVTSTTSAGIIAKAAPMMLAIVLLGTMMSACTQADIKANEDKAAAIWQAVKNGARMSASVVKEGIDSLCANAADVNFVANGVRGGIGLQSGPNTEQNLKNLDTAMATLSSVCSRAAANPNDPAIRSLLQTAWISYNAAKTAAKAGG